MRVAVLPIVTIGNVKGASEILHLSPKFFRNVDDVFFYEIVPKRLKGKLPDLGYKCGVIWSDDTGWVYYDQEMAAPAAFIELFNERIGKYPIDAIWTTRTPMAASISRMLWDFRTMRPTIPVFVEEFKAGDYGYTHNVVRDEELMERSLGYAVNHAIFNTEVEQKIAVSAARRYLQGNMVEKILNNSTIIGLNVEIDEIEEAIKGVEKKEKFTCFFGGRLNEAKRAKSLVAIYDEFFQFGRDVDILMTSPRAEQVWQNKELRAKYPEVKFIFEVDRQSFLKELASCHVVLSRSKHEAFTVGILEMIYSGPVVILPDEYWVRGLLGDYMRLYPFIYKNSDEAKMLLRYVYENYEECQKKMFEPRSWVKRTWGFGYSKDYGEMRAKFITKTVQEREKPVTKWFKEDNVELIKKAIAEVDDPFTIDELYQKVIDVSDSYRANVSPVRGKMSKYAVYKWLKLSGYRDLCDGMVAKFRKL